MQQKLNVFMYISGEQVNKIQGNCGLVTRLSKKIYKKPFKSNEAYFYVLPNDPLFASSFSHLYHFFFFSLWLRQADLKTMVTMRVFVLVATLTLCHATCSSREECCSSFAASRSPNYYLGCDSHTQTLPDVNLTACIRTCLQTLSCFSTNFKQNTDQHQCELLKHTRKTIAQSCFVRKDGWEYNEVKVV